MNIYIIMCIYIYIYIYTYNYIYISIYGILAGELGRQGGSQQGDIGEGASHTTETLAWRGGLVGLPPSGFVGYPLVSWNVRISIGSMVMIKIVGKKKQQTSSNITGGGTTLVPYGGFYKAMEHGPFTDYLLIQKGDFFSC